MAHATAAHPAAGRFDNVHGDEGGIDLAPHMENALESVVETIMNFGEYPQPRRVGLFITTGSPRRKQYDLYEELQDEKFIEHADLLEFFICAMNDYSTCGAFSDLRGRWEKRLTEHLLDKLADSEIVRDKALEYAEEERETA